MKLFPIVVIFSGIFCVGTGFLPPLDLASIICWIVGTFNIFIGVFEIYTSRKGNVS